MTTKITAVFGMFLFAAASAGACAGDGVNSDGDSDDDDSSGSGGSRARGGSGGSNASNGGSNTARGGSGGSSAGSGGSLSSGQGGSPASSTGGLMTTGGYHESGGLKGYFWTDADKGGSTIMPAMFSAASPNICVTGTAAKVEGEAYGTTYGALVGWNVKQGPMPPNDPETTALAASGTFTINLTGTVPSPVRFKVRVGTTDYCKDLDPGSNTVKLSDLKKECWLLGAMVAYAGEPVKDVAVQVVTNASSASTFNFCLTEMNYTP
jgi:hypothetical protein